jgi:SnoaL-like polyketide cyclase
MGKPPSGKEFATEHIHIWRIEDDKVIEHWSVRDDLGQALQRVVVAHFELTSSVDFYIEYKLIPSASEDPGD